MLDNILSLVLKFLCSSKGKELYRDPTTYLYISISSLVCGPAFAISSAQANLQWPHAGALRLESDGDAVELIHRATNDRRGATTTGHDNHRATTTVV